jgi:tRNA-2-methylthio-N6-dimethylallyladenosine synthase
MGRGHTREEYLEKIAALKKSRPELSITSDFIVAYPGETEEDFEQTLDLVDRVQFDQSFSFIYSPRPGTLAAGLECSLTEEEKKDRLKRLQDKLNAWTKQHHAKMLHQVYRVLITEKSQEGSTMEGRTEQNKVVHIQGAHPQYIGVFVDVLITEVLGNSLRGRFIRVNDSYLTDQRLMGASDLHECSENLGVSAECV